MRDAYGMIALCAAEAEDHADQSISAGCATIWRRRCRCRWLGCTSTWCGRPTQLYEVLPKTPRGQVLSLGVIDGRNIWRTDLDAILMRLESVVGGAAPTTWARAIVLAAARAGRPRSGKRTRSRAPALAGLCPAEDGRIVGAEPGVGAGPRRGARRARREPWQRSPRAGPRPRCMMPRWRRGTAAIEPWMSWRTNPYSERRQAAAGGAEAAGVPHHHHRLVPADRTGAQGPRGVRQGASWTRRTTNAFLRGETEAAVTWQEEIGLDVLVHGEFERNDMVEYFGEQLAGYAFTKHGWVQSYGSRCVRPPIIYGDVSRPQPMTVEWSRYRPVADLKADEGHAHRPGDHAAVVVRARRPAARGGRAGRSRSPCATRWRDLEAAGSRVIQIDEPALREGLPLRRAGVARLSRLGGATRSGSRPRACVTTPRSTPTCATRNSTTSSRRSRPSMPTSSRSRPRARQMELLRGVRALPLSQRDRPRRLRHPFAARAGRG